MLPGWQWQTFSGVYARSARARSDSQVPASQRAGTLQWRNSAHQAPVPSSPDRPPLLLVSGSGQVRYRLGERLVDRHLEFVAGGCRPNTLRAVALDLKAFFTVVAKDPVRVTGADVFEFVADQRGDRTVVRLADRESGLSARTTARRLSSVRCQGLSKRSELQCPESR